MPEIEIMPIPDQNISQEMMDDLPEDVLEDIVSGSIFEPNVELLSLPVNEPETIVPNIELLSLPVNESETIVPKSETQEIPPQAIPIQVEQKEEILNTNPFDSVNNVAHVLASSSRTLPLPLPVYGGKKRRFRLTKKSK